MGFGPPTILPIAPFDSEPRIEAVTTPWLRTFAGLATELMATVSPTANVGETPVVELEPVGVEGVEPDVLVELLELVEPVDEPVVVDDEVELLDPPVPDVPTIGLLEVGPTGTIPGTSVLLALKTTNVPYAGAVC
jgi:hypothetical protein